MPNPRYVHPEIKIGGTALETAVMDDVLEITVEQAIFLPWTFSFVLLDENLTHIDDEKFTPGKEVEISVKEESGSNVEQGSLMKGVITAVEPEFRSDKTPVLRVRGYDKGYKLSQGKHTRTFLKQTDSNIINSIVGENGLTAVKDDSPEQHEHVFQYAQSDWDFIVTRARRLGFIVFMDGDKLNFKNPVFGTETVTVNWGEDLLNFEPRLSALGQETQAIAQGWDHHNKTQIKSTASSASVNYAQNGYAKTGIATMQEIKGATTGYEVNLPVATVSYAQKVANGQILEKSSEFIRAEGRCYGNPLIKAGSPIKVDKVGTRFSGKYFLTEVRHIFDKGDYWVWFSASGYEPETLHGLLQPESSRKANSRIDGVVTAIVTNISDPNKQGRVKVKYPWLDDSMESDWAPVATPGAGNDRGITFVPEINDEVLVAFDHGDINYPYVLGGLWNSKDIIPAGAFPSEGQYDQRIIRSRSGHTIILNDKDGEGSITIKDKNAENTIIIDTENGDINMKSKAKVMIESGAELTITSGGDLTLDSKGKVVVKSQAATTVTAQAKVELKGNAGMAIETSGQATFKGSTVEVNGTGSTAVKSTGMLEIQGSLVKIN